MNADELYRALAGDAWKFTKNSILDVEDIQQALYVKCMEVAEGQSNYIPSVGTVENYIMGWLWKDTIKWQKMQSLDAIVDDVDVDSEVARIFPQLQLASVEDDLIRRDEMHAQFKQDKAEIRLRRQQMKDKTTLAILIKTGYWTTRDAAKYFGVCRNAVEKSLKNGRTVQSEGAP